jgi:hypothetical protein
MTTRCVKHDGRLYVGVTSAMALVKILLGEKPDFYGQASVANVHALEGTACHAACLDWLAHTHGLIPSYSPPAWDHAQHPDEIRWNNVMCASVSRFIEFCSQYEVEPIGIEQEAFSAAYGLVGHIDLYCLLTWKKKRVRAVIDLKFVHKLQRSHDMQLRCYAKLDGINEARLGLLFHCDRESSTWSIRQVDLHEHLDDVAAVANAARLCIWAEQHG